MSQVQAVVPIQRTEERTDSMHTTMMQRLMIQAEPELVERAKRRARERGVSVAQLVREAIEHELGRIEDEKIPPPLTCIGAFDSGRSDLSELASENIFTPLSWRS
jgi:predicted DNA-binding protein